MKKSVLFIFLFLFLLNLNAQVFSVSDDLKISLITCSPGKEIYARFGHTAVRINDPTNNIDIVFNYGIFNFNTQNFYLKFIKGETDYNLAAYDFSSFLPEYAERNSWVWEQVLNLNLTEKERLIDLLLVNYQPENRTYRYNFVFDNCSTRPRDKIKEALDGRLVYQNPETENTFRDWIELYVGTDSWLKFGIDMIFGDDSDIIATERESMFLPEVLMDEFHTATVVLNGENNETRPLISEYNIIVNKNPEKKKELFILFYPFSITSFLLILGFLFLFKQHKYHKFYKSFDSFLFITIGLIGCIAVYLSFFSQHPLVKHNANIMWLNPLFLVVGITQWFKPLKLITFFILLLNSILLVVILFLYIFNVHYFNIAFIPLIFLLYVRTYNYIRTRLKIGFKIGNRKIQYSLKR